MSGPGGDGGDDPKPFRQTPKTGGDGGGGAAGGPIDRCVFTEIATLSSPNPAVIATLNVRDELRVVLETVPSRRVVVMTAANAIAGSITSARVVEIMQCISDGFNYAATVTEIDGGRVTVEVHPA
jgi:hypothetical protein